MKRSISLLLLLFVSGSCSKYLDTTPDLRTEITDAAGVAELLSSAYPRANYIVFAEAASDNAQDKGSAVGNIVPVNFHPWRYSIIENRQEDSPEFYWHACYRAIAAANQALAAIDNLGAGPAYASLRGEALVARAYAHFMLVTFFASPYNALTAASDPGIPYVTAPEESVISPYDRGTVATVYEAIEADLTAGIPLIDDRRYRVPKYHFTQAAAHAFAARFYLFKQEWALVIAHANQVYASDISQHIITHNSAFFRSLEYGARSAFYSSPINTGSILQVEAQTLWARNFASYRYGLSSDLLSELFYSGNVTGGSFAYSIYGGTELVYNIPKFVEHFVRESVNATQGRPFNMLVLFSADELLMNRAEAYANLGNHTEAIADLNAFASAKIYVSQNNPVYLPDVHQINEQKLSAFYNSRSLSENIVQAVLDFKRREFIFEGIRWFDILRHRLPVTHRSYDQQEVYFLGPNDNRRMFQLPGEVVLSGVQQNPR